MALPLLLGARVGVRAQLGEAPGAQLGEVVRVGGAAAVAERRVEGVDLGVDGGLDGLGRSQDGGLDRC